MEKTNQQKSWLLRLESMMRTYWTYCNSVDFKELNETTYRTLLGLWRPEIYSDYDIKIGNVFKYKYSDTNQQFNERLIKLHKEMGIASVLSHMEKTDQEKRLEEMMWTYFNSVGFKELNETTYRTLLRLSIPEKYSKFDIEIGNVFKYQSSDTSEQFKNRMLDLHTKMRIMSKLFIEK